MHAARRYAKYVTSSYMQYHIIHAISHHQSNDMCTLHTDDAKSETSSKTQLKGTKHYVRICADLCGYARKCAEMCGNA